MNGPRRLFVSTAHCGGYCASVFRCFRRLDERFFALEVLNRHGLAQLLLSRDDWVLTGQFLVEWTASFRYDGSSRWLAASVFRCFGRLDERFFALEVLNRHCLARLSLSRGDWVLTRQFLVEWTASFRFDGSLRWLAGVGFPLFRKARRMFFCFRSA